MNNDDHEKAKELIETIGTAYRAAQVFEEETGYKISISTLKRVMDGEAKPAMMAFVRYALTNASLKA